MLRQRAVTHYINICLGKFPVPALLRTLPPPYFLYLPALEGENKAARIFNHISGQRHSKVKMEAKMVFYRGIILPKFLEAGQQIYLLARLPLFQQAGARLHCACFDPQKSMKLENPAKSIDNTLFYNTFLREPLRESRN